MEGSNGIAALVLLVTPQGIPLVRDPSKGPMIYWKLPGGKGQGEETAEDCAVREMQEETGAELLATNLQLIFREKKRDHVKFAFRADLAQLPVLRERGDEGEEIRVFQPAEILALEDFFPSHAPIVWRILRGLASL
ncbi:MAG: NUDIX hydrolase [Candidatus Pacebacteria bacterium]|nr:NUDIX hydrolase [Candidatus Paceibacterota bacterium]